MALRFLDTDFFKHPFVRSLEGAYKGLYCFIICDCDNAGIWSPDFQIASLYLGQKVEQKKTEQVFAGKFIPLENGRWFFPDFINRQYPKGLSAKNPAHSKIIATLTKLGFLDENHKLTVASKGLPSTSQATKVVVEDKGMVEIVDKRPLEIQFSEFNFNGHEPIKESVLKLAKIVDDNFTEIQKLQKPLCPNDIIRLVELKRPQDVMSVLRDMNNRKTLLKDYKFAYSTAISWLEKRGEKKNV